MPYQVPDTSPFFLLAQELQKTQPSVIIIAQQLYSLGNTAKAKRLRYELSELLFTAALTRLQLAARTAMHIAKSFYGLGLIAQSGKLAGKVSAEIIQSLLSRLLSARPNAIDIAQSFYGLGLMAQAKKLTGKVSSVVIQDLLSCLLAPGMNPTPQAIAMSLYGLGLLAQSGCLAGQVPSQLIQSLLSRILTPDMNLKSQHISNCIYGLGLLAQSGCLAGQVSAELIQNLLSCLFAPDMNLDSQEIANSIYGLGLLAQSGCLAGQVSAELIQSLLSRLSASDMNPEPRHIGMSLHGLGLLAQSGQLAGEVSAEIIARFLSCLFALGMNPDSQAIANSIHGLGLLAQSGQLAGEVSAEVIDHFLSCLFALGMNPDLQSIAMSLHGLGLLAQSGQLAGEVSAEVIDRLLSYLFAPGMNLNALDIAMSLHGLGLLAQSGQLIGDVSAELIQSLFSGLLASGMNPNSQHIAMSLHGLGLLAQSGQLVGDVSAEVIERLLSHLSASDMNSEPQAIAMSLHGLGLLAQSGQLIGDVSAELIQDLLSCLLAPGMNLNPQKIGMSLHGLGLLAQSGQLAGDVSAKVIQGLLSYIQARGMNLKAQEIAMSLHGLGLLAQSRQLVGDVSAEVIQYLSSCLLAPGMNLKPREIAVSLRGIARLVNAAALNIPSNSYLLSHAWFNQYLQTVTDDEFIFIPLCLFDLVQIGRVNSQFFNAQDCIEPMSKLIDKCMIHLPRLRLQHVVYLFDIIVYLVSKSDVNNLSLNNHLFSYLNQCNQHLQNVDLQYFSEDMRQIMQNNLVFMNYLLRDEEANAAEAVNVMEDLSMLDDANHGYVGHTDDILDREVHAAPRPIRSETSQPTNTKKRGYALISDSEGKVQSSKRVKQPHLPKISRTAWDNLAPDVLEAANKNQIFNIIYRGDKTRLERFLLLAGSQSHVGSASISRRNSNHVQVAGNGNHHQHGDDERVPRLRKDYSRVDNNVLTFFTKTNAHALRALILEKDASWFLLLIRACSISMRYQLAYRDCLYLVLTYLKLPELKVFINTLLSQGYTLQVNHHVVLTLVGNLTERMVMESDAHAKQEIKALQLSLLQSGLDQHKYHNKVRANLAALYRCCQVTSLSLGLQQDFNELSNLEPEDAITVFRRQNENISVTPTPASVGLPEPQQASRIANTVLSGSANFYASSRMTSQVSSIRIAIIGDGNCLYNTAAVGIQKYPELLFKLWHAFVAFDGMNSFLRADLSLSFLRDLAGMHSTRQADVFINQMQNLSHDRIQKQLAPILRYVALQYLLKKRSLLNTSIFIPDEDNLKAVFAIASGQQAEDYMGLSRIDFIMEKVRTLNQHVSGLHEKIQQFRVWWQQEGEEAYLNYLCQSATSAADIHLWGSEIELGALCELLEMTVASQGRAGSTLLGKQEGLVPIGELNSDDLSQASSLLMGCDLAEVVDIFDVSQQAIVPMIHFKTGAMSSLDILTKLPQYVNEQRQLVDLSLHRVEFQMSHLQQRATYYGETVQAYLQKRVDIYPQAFLQALQCRQILTPEGCFITHSNGDIDYARITRQLRVISMTAKDWLMTHLQTATPLFTAVNEAGHWFCILNQPTMRSGTTAESSASSVRNYPSSMHFHPAKAASSQGHMTNSASQSSFVAR